MNLVIFGPQGSGKGTQAKLLKEYLEIHDSGRKTLYVETGQKFRDFITSDKSYSRDLTKQVIDEGGLMPEFMPIWIWADFLVKNFTGKEHLILDGLSRRPHEAPILAGSLDFYKVKNPIVIVLNVSRDWALERLTERKRGDDDPTKITKRLDWYWENVLPAVEYFSTRPEYIYKEINGEHSIEEVHKDIVSAIESL